MIFIINVVTGFVVGGITEADSPELARIITSLGINLGINILVAFNYNKIHMESLMEKGYIIQKGYRLNNLEGDEKLYEKYVGTHEDKKNNIYDHEIEKEIYTDKEDNELL